MKIALIGGDARFLYTEAALAAAGHTVCRMANQDRPFDGAVLLSCDAAVLPLPVTRDGEMLNAKEAPAPLPLSRLFSCLPVEIKLLIGRRQAALAPYLIGRRVAEYGADESFLTENSLLSADGAFSLLKEENNGVLPSGLYTIVGSGHLAKALGSRLAAEGIRFAAYARRAGVPIGGTETLPLTSLPSALAFTSVLLNTVPVGLYTEELLQHADGGLWLLELAAVSGVVDESAAERRGIRLLPAPALPLRYAKEAAGQAIAGAVLSALSHEVFL